MSKRPNALYHFTCRAWWHFIKTEGITKGKVPLAATDVLECPNLTSNPERSAQRWACVGEIAADKTAVRIAVEIPPDDDKLISWRDFAIRSKVDRRCYRGLDESGGWEARNWWLYLGAIPPEWFTDVEFLDDGKVTEVEAGMLRACERSASYREAVWRMAVRYEDGVQVLDPFAVTIDVPSRPAPAPCQREQPEDVPWGTLRARLHDPDLHAEIESADVVLGLNPRTGEPKGLYYGAAHLERIGKGNEAEEAKVLRVPVDSATDDVEVLVAMVQALKGAHCYGAVAAGHQP